MNISDQIKFIETLNIQQSLPILTLTATPEEKTSIKKLYENFLQHHKYFGNFWSEIDAKACKIVLEMLGLGKGVISHEKIRNFLSPDLAPENENFFEKNKFFSDLKTQAISDSEYEDAKHLFKTLRMGNLNDRNDLYNA